MPLYPTETCASTILLTFFSVAIGPWFFWLWLRKICPLPWRHKNDNVHIRVEKILGLRLRRNFLHKRLFGRLLDVVFCRVLYRDLQSPWRLLLPQKSISTVRGTLTGLGADTEIVLNSGGVNGWMDFWMTAIGALSGEPAALGRHLIRYHGTRNTCDLYLSCREQCFCSQTALCNHLGFVKRAAFKSGKI